MWPLAQLTHGVVEAICIDYKAEAVDCAVGDALADAVGNGVGDSKIVGMQVNDSVVHLGEWGGDYF